MTEGVFRPNVGIVLLNHQSQVFFAKRLGKENWQFPQGGIHSDESLTEALYRELHEEIGLLAHQVTIISKTTEDLHYFFPTPIIREEGKKYIGQKQCWFLLKLIVEDSAINLYASDEPEFEEWQWVNYWYPLDHIVEFKKAVYQEVLTQFSVSAIMLPR